MTVRELYGSLREKVDQGFGDLDVRCCNHTVEWSWIIVDDGKFDHVELSLLRLAEEVENE